MDINFTKFTRKCYCIPITSQNILSNPFFLNLNDDETI